MTQREADRRPGATMLVGPWLATPLISCGLYSLRTVYAKAFVAPTALESCASSAGLRAADSEPGGRRGLQFLASFDIISREGARS